MSDRFVGAGFNPHDIGPDGAGTGTPETDADHRGRARRRSRAGLEIGTMKTVLNWSWPVAFRKPAINAPRPSLSIGGTERRGDPVNSPYERQWVEEG